MADPLPPACHWQSCVLFQGLWICVVGEAEVTFSFLDLFSILNGPFQTIYSSILSQWWDLIKRLHVSLFNFTVCGVILKDSDDSSVRSPVPGFHTCRFLSMPQNVSSPFSSCRDCPLYPLWPDCALHAAILPCPPFKIMLSLLPESFPSMDLVHSWVPSYMLPILKFSF